MQLTKYRQFLRSLHIPVPGQENPVDQGHVDNVLMYLKAFRAEIDDIAMLGLSEGHKKYHESMGNAKGSMGTLENYINIYSGRGMHNYRTNEWQKDVTWKPDHTVLESEAQDVLNGLENAAYHSRQGETKARLLAMRGRFRKFKLQQLAVLGGYVVEELK